MKNNAIFILILTAIALFVANKAAYSLQIEKSVDTEPPRYAPDRIIVKFRTDVANIAENQLDLNSSASGLTLSQGLDQLNARYKTKEIKPLFRNFRKRQQQLKTLQGKNEAALTQKEKHILARLKRAPKDAQIPDLDHIYTIEFEPDPNMSIEEIVEAYNSDPDVEYAEPDYIVSICKTPDDPLYPIQWSLNNIGQMYPESGRFNHPPGTPDADIDAPDAWGILTGNSEVIVAVIDTGVDYTHRDLDDNMWINIGEIPGNGIDDDGNGYIDDIYGYDFCTLWDTRDSDPMDDRGHGTHCAGIITAEGNNGNDISGVCWNVKIMAAKFLNALGWGANSDAVEAFYYAVENGAEVTSNSWGGGGYSRALEEAINYAHSQGVITVASAGNSGNTSPQCPAYYDYVISVAATDSQDNRASFSTYGSWVDIAAPGVDILSLRAKGTFMGKVYNDYTTIASGTSMACPHVAGVCALMLSINPQIDINDIEQTLLQSTDPIEPSICASGRLNAFQATIQTLNPKGWVFIKSDVYSCSSLMEMLLGDSHLMGNGTQQVTIETNGGDFETVALTENSIPGLFTGTIPTSSSTSVIEDGIVQLSHGRIITVTYQDVNDGTGNPATATDTATADCQPPAVSNVQLRLPGRQPKITFETDEPSTARILCGLECGGPYEITSQDPNLKTAHSIKLTGVSPETDYFFIIEIIDAVGNMAIEDNSGACYTFTTIAADSEIYVPTQCDTIQEAIDNSWDTGTVWVAPGTYSGDGNRDIDFKGRAITVTSEQGPELTIIDCEGKETEPHRGFLFHSGEDANSVLDGFTIINGYVESNGGGIYCSQSSPTITNCSIWANRAVISGGGIMCDNASPTITNCRLTGNLALGEDGCGGAISFYDSSLTITNCVITNNRAVKAGGGIHCNFSSTTIIGCTVNKNSAKHWGGGLASIGWGSAPVIENCHFVDNSAKECGGGLFLLSPAVVKNCFITNNSAGGDGGGIFAVENPAIYNSIITNNSAENNGGGIYAALSSETVTNCTIINNSAKNLGGGIFCRIQAQTDLTATNCIIWANSNPQLNLYLNVTYCDIQGGYPGEGNIDANPCFALATDYHLMPNSPCIDAGTNEPDGGLPETDLEGNPRPVDGDSNGTATADMGVYEYNPSGPSIAASSFSFSFLHSRWEPAGPQILQIRNCGVGTLNWEIVEDCPWLNAAPTSGTSTDQINQVVLTVDANSLAPGDYTASFDIAAQNAVNNPVNISVRLQIPHILNVPSEYDTIQAAIDAAWDMYDIVLVADGTYTGPGNRDIDFRGRAITVRSTNGPENCIIDCEGSLLNPHFAFVFHNSESCDSVVCGFTITGACPPPEWFYEGPPIYCDKSGATISNCTLTGNITAPIYCSESDVKIKNCRIVGNVDDSAGHPCGAIASFDSRCTVTNCQIGDRGISVIGGNPDTSSPCSLRVENCLFSTEGSSIFCLDTVRLVVTDCTFTSSSIRVDHSPVTITNCIFNGGQKVTMVGALRCEYCDVVISNCKISSYSGNGNGSAINSWRSNVTITNCLITGNSATARGTICSDEGSLTMNNCTITGNFAKRGGGGLYFVGTSKPSVNNCILWNNRANIGPQLYGVSVPAYSCIQNWTGGGTGNISTDPCFVNPGFWDPNGTPANTSDDFWVEGDYHLLEGSPCINTGDPAYAAGPNETDLDGRPRILLGRVDMGAYEFNHISVADAGDDQTVYAWIDGNAPVTLDGSDSNDPDDDELTYKWTWEIEGYVYEANGVNPTIELPVGEHIIKLVVNDGIEDSEPDEVVITVVPAVQADMKVTPQTLNLDSHGNWVKAHFVMPDDIAADQIDTNAPAVFEPAGIESDYINVFVNEEGLVEVEIAFDRSAFCAAPMDYGSIEVTVAGSLISGQYFYGTDTIRIMTHDIRCLAFLASHWLETDCGRPDWCGAFDRNRSSKVDFADFSIFADYWLAGK